MPETPFQSFLSQLPLSSDLVVGLMNFMSMTLEEKRTIRVYMTYMNEN